MQWNFYKEEIYNHPIAFMDLQKADLDSFLSYLKPVSTASAFQMKVEHLSMAHQASESRFLSLPNSVTMALWPVFTRSFFLSLMSHGPSPNSCQPNSLKSALCSS